MSAAAEKKTDLTADGFVSVEEAGDFLSMSRSSIYKLMDSGQLRWCKFGKARRIPWVALRHFAQNCLDGVA